MIEAPPWLKRGTWACHLPTRSVFQPQSCSRDRRSRLLLLSDMAGAQYPAEDCDRLSLSHLGNGARLVTGAGEAVTIEPSTAGLTIGSWLIQLPEPDEGLEAARSLAQMFNGEVRSEEARDAL